MPSVPLVRAPQAGPSESGVRANPGMFEGQARAAEGFGQAVAGIGDLAFRIKHAEDYAAITKANTALDTAWTEFQTELADPTNPENGDVSTWSKRWQSKQQDVKEQIAPFTSALSPVAKQHLAGQTNDWGKKTNAQLNQQATVRKLENAKSDVITDYNTKLRQGDLPGALRAVEGAVPFGILHKEEADTLKAGAVRKVEHYQASSLIMQDPIAAEAALGEKDKDGKPTEFTHLDDDARLTLTFEAHRRAVQLRSETANDLFERAQQGQPAGADEVNGLVATGRLSAAQAKAYLKPPKPEFDPVKFADLMTDIAKYDPAKDGDRHQYSTLMQRAAYDGDLKGAAASDAVEMLKKKADPKSELNTPVAKAAIAAVDDAFNKGLYGQFNTVTPGTAENNFQPKKQVDFKIYARAKAEQMKNLDAVTAYLTKNPDASREDTFKFISGLHSQAIATQGADIFAKKNRTPDVTPEDLDKLLNAAGYKAK